MGGGLISQHNPYPCRLVPTPPSSLPFACLYQLAPAPAAADSCARARRLAHACGISGLAHLEGRRIVRVFDESCEHEVEVNGGVPRTVLLVDFANPLLLSPRDYVSVAMRLTCTHELSETALEAETLDAEKEWKEVQARWQEMRHEDEEL
jgi:hypothetical protein